MYIVCIYIATSADADASIKRQRDRQIDSQIDRQTDTEREIDGWRDRQKNRRKERSIESGRQRKDKELYLENRFPIYRIKMI